MVLDSTNQWANQQQCIDFHCTVMSWCSASFPRTEGIGLDWIGLDWRMGGEVILFSFFFFFVIPLTCGCFYGGNIARVELNYESWDRSPISVTEVLQTASIPGLYLPLWYGEGVTYVIEPPWMLFTRQRLLRCAAWLCRSALYCRPDLLWFLAFVSSSWLFPAVLVYWPKIFPGLQSNENQN